MAVVSALLDERGRSSIWTPPMSVKRSDDMNYEDFSKKEFKDAEQTVKKTSKRETVMTSLFEYG
ncbi:hypothetical protein BT69DRAFT_1353621 [Atractiella rhizophila]|nr:hypothetical protein BT69DRAFT_1353621 [Atractiella rhizophila]